VTVKPGRHTNGGHDNLCHNLQLVEGGQEKERRHI